MAGMYCQTVRTMPARLASSITTLVGRHMRVEKSLRSSRILGGGFRGWFSGAKSRFGMAVIGSIGMCVIVSSEDREVAPEPL